MNKKLPERRPIESFGEGGFRFGDHSHRGHLLILPSGMRAWDGDDFSAIIAEMDGFDFLVIGTGAKFERVSAGALARLEALGIRPDVMATSAAVHTYNLMFGEDRRVACALKAVG
ncbi:Mth938-like domain-containing protein [Aestuariivirga litoralis]|uniref:Mth938-like domain-containing protein n=1 Tax=Aestuariivirga litoralis TaxID=2650924 RepID=UPI0018C8231D|nr:Mth938-like domain-containing protein [Aestuariivirga litoralis]MBG1231475.1 hypothetical protein [Aestuariivirga litoralis]